MKNTHAQNLEMDNMPSTNPHHQTKTYQNFAEFWPAYQAEHRNLLNRRLHFVGTNLALGLIALSIVFFNPWLALAGIISGYAFAWIGHFFFEKNRPLTFKYPWMSLKADFKAFFLTWKKFIQLRPDGF